MGFSTGRYTLLKVRPVTSVGWYMKLSEILDSLASSELANLNFVDNGDIVQAKIPKIVNAINLGLVKLYTRFKLKRYYYSSNYPSITAYELTTPNVFKQ